MGVHTIIGVRDTPTLDKLYYNHWLEPSHIADVLTHVLNAGTYDAAESLNVDRFLALLHETEPEFQFEDRQLICHPNNIKYAFPFVQGDLEYLFEITLGDSPTIELWKTHHNWSLRKDDSANQFSYQIYWSYVDWRFFSLEKLEQVVQMAGVIEHFYDAEFLAGEKKGNPAMFINTENLHDLTGELSQIGH